MIIEEWEKRLIGGNVISIEGDEKRCHTITIEKDGITSKLYLGVYWPSL